MATINGSTNNNQWTFKLEVSEGSYNITNNTSPVTVSIYLGRSSSTSYIGGNWSGNITVDGSSQSINGTIAYPTYINAGEYILLATKTFTVSHNNDGSKTASVSSSISSSEFTPSNASASGSVTLATIPRASTIACSSPYIGDNAIITIDKKDSSFVNTVTYQIGSLTGTVETKTSSTTLQLKTSQIADQIYALFPNAKEIQGTVYCTTYRKVLSAFSKVGDTQSATFNLYAKESECKPSVTATIIDTNESSVAVTANNTKFIKYISKPKVTITATPKKNSTIKSYSINLNDGQTSNLQENTFDTISSNKVTVSVTDSRGYSNSVDISLDMVDYVRLHINAISITRSEGTSNEAILNCDGAYFNGSFTDTVSNSLSASFKYRLSGATDWTDGGSITPTIENNTFKFTDLSLGNLFNYDEEYQFMITLEDTFMIANETVSLEKGQEAMAIGEDSVWVYGDLFLNDNYIIESGSNENGEYIKFADGTMICKDTKAYPITAQQTMGALFYGYLILDDFPVEFISIPTITFAQHNAGSVICLQPYGFESDGKVSKSSPGGVYPISANVINDPYNLTISYIAIGKWK